MELPQPECGCRVDWRTFTALTTFIAICGYDGMNCRVSPSINDGTIDAHRQSVMDWANAQLPELHRQAGQKFGDE